MRKSRSKEQVQFPDSYREDLFWFWYKAGRPSIAQLLKVMPPYLEKHLPTYGSLGIWVKKSNWHERADELDARVAHEVEKQAIAERVEMLRRHADVGEELIQKGHQYLKEHGLEDDKAAISAIRIGVQIEAGSRGLPDAVFKVADMSDNQVVNTIEKLMGKIPDQEKLAELLEDVIEGEIVEDGPE